ncbi:flagellar assembly peptidoglycan hydrolase FlgJ [Limnohabitans sp. G3-2]|uniref:flagellar assembly peptidoglycan hydrolase FlgJ n=1 Tax=Limnohabitans sp. G3-2 TaxID=1100711 RepID=UPI000C1F6932|nr:flagellar assembly peptidoglycan hydrolase FlgJ [Limnohabitans sp. G3-2]PIT73274.1 flagellar assembly peptidoglycan hydrolase FlgJ [Limnohabitans sp. G3-2]
MTLLATPFAPAASDASDRLAGASARSGPLPSSTGAQQGVAFSQALSKLKPTADVVTVRPGDTLSGLIQKQLKDTHSPLQLSGEQLYRVALKVAADNGIANANLIYPDQRIDLSSAQPLALAEALNPDRSVTPYAKAQSSDLNTAGPHLGGQGHAVGQRAFLAQHAQAAQQAQATSGIPATFMVAQAALETGWGQREIRFEDGRSSHNLFGIRAGGNWKGPVAEVWTTEFVNGSAQKVRGQFRAYGSYEESFKDYARLISQNPRYAPAMRQLDNPQAFASALQQAGYATAPNYASVLASMIEKTQRLQGTAAPTLAGLNAPGRAQPMGGMMPTTAQMLSMRQGGQGTSEAALGLMNSALNTLPGGQGATLVGLRQWRQSPYAELSLPTPTPNPLNTPIPILRP